MQHGGILAGRADRAKGMFAVGTFQNKVKMSFQFIFGNIVTGGLHHGLDAIIRNGNGLFHQSDFLFILDHAHSGGQSCDVSDINVRMSVADLIEQIAYRPTLIEFHLGQFTA